MTGDAVAGAGGVTAADVSSDILGLTTGLLLDEDEDDDDVTGPLENPRNDLRPTLCVGVTLLFMFGEERRSVDVGGTATGQS